MKKIAFFLIFNFQLALVNFDAFSQTYQVNGNASQLSCNCYLLTPDLNAQGGSVWNINQISLANSFDFTFDVFLGYNDVGADGIAFVLQPISTIVGTSGGGIGYLGISPSLAIEIDTYQNSGYGDPATDHIGIQSNGDVDHNTGNNLAGPVAALASSGNIEDGQNHLLRVSWDATAQILQAYFDGVLRVTYTGNIVSNIFSNNPNVYWGFTGSTGGQRNEQRFCLSIIPDFSLSVPSVCEGETLQLTDSSYSGLGSIASWNWDFGNGTASTDTNPSITYNTAGTYQITQTVVDQAGCSDSNTTSITVLPLPDVGFTVENNCSDNPVLFTDTTNGTPGSWNWSFGDGENSTEQNPIHSYADAGTYIVSLNVESTDGCSATQIINVVINASPTASADMETSLLTVNFTNTSTGAESYEWIFPDTTLTTVSPSYTFADTGHYPVTLVATSANGCTDTIVFDVYVDNTIQVEVPNIFTPNGDSYNDVWIPTLKGVERAIGRIYNRWGMLMADFSETVNTWDGKTKGGNDVPEGTYFYVLDYTTIDGKSDKAGGTITLVR